MSTIKKDYNVVGMGCAACVNHVQTALVGQKGVVNANVDLASHTAHVEYDENEVTPQQLKAAVDAAGYQLEI